MRSFDDEFQVQVLVDWREDVEEAKLIVNESQQVLEYAPFKPQRVSYHSERHCAVWHHRGCLWSANMSQASWIIKMDSSMGVSPP